MAQSITLVLITRDLLARIDLRGGRRVSSTGVWSCPRIESDDLATLIDVALRQGPKRRAGVHVLSTDFWTGTIEVARELTAQLAGDTLSQTLGFEAETYSGIGGFDSEIEFRQLLGAPEPTYWVTQIPLETRATAGRAVAAWGGKLLGLGHPASAHPPGTEPTASWARVECWDDVVLIASPSSHSPTRVSLLAGDGRGDAARRQFEPRLLELSGSETSQRPLARFQWWNARHGDTPWLPSAWTELGRDEPSDLQQWAIDWWNARDVAIRPLFSPLKTTLSPTTTALVGVALATLTGLGCAGHYAWLSSQRADIERQVEELADQKKQFDDQKKVVTELETQLADRQRVADLLQTDLRWANRVGVLQARMHQHLLDGIAATCPADVMLTKIEPQEETTLLAGYALGDRACDDFVEELARWLAPHGWQVSPASVKRDAEKHPTLYTFEITVREQSEAWFTRELEPVPSPDTTMVPPTTRSSVQPVPITRLGTASDVPTFASSRGNGSRDVKNQRKPEA